MQVVAVEGNVVKEGQQKTAVANRTVVDEVVVGTALGWLVEELPLAMGGCSSSQRDLQSTVITMQHLSEVLVTCDWVRAGLSYFLLGLEHMAVKTGVVGVEDVAVARFDHKEPATEGSSFADVAAGVGSKKPLAVARHMMALALVLEMGKVPELWRGSQSTQLAAHSCPFVVRFRCSSSPYQRSWRHCGCSSTCSIVAHHIDLMCTHSPFGPPTSDHSIALR